MNYKYNIIMIMILIVDSSGLDYGASDDDDDGGDNDDDNDDGNDDDDDDVMYFNVLRF